ncbi:MAG: hypothetical protein IPN62_02545 [Flavobacteriales bacterium]|nr:hypothetical protein [Flavobacteriales bacterium]
MIDFKNYFEAIEHGASRSRILVQFLMFGTFLTFLGLFNSLKPDWNWLGSRIGSHHIAAEWVCFANDTVTPDTLTILKSGRPIRTVVNRMTPGQFLAHTEQDMVQPFSDTTANKKLLNGWMAANVWVRFPAHAIQERRAGSPHRVVDWSAIDKQEMGIAINRLATLRCHDDRELQWILTNLHKAQVDNAMLIEVPILGLSFDINSLAIISGLAFMILYFLLFYSLSRELKNITLLFRIHRERDITSRDIYQLLSMYQVLTIPRSIDRFISATGDDLATDLAELDKDSNRRKRWMPQVPVVLPILAWIAVFAYDLTSRSSGIATNASLTNTNATISLVIGLLVAASLIRCLRVWRGINRQWDDKAREVVVDLFNGIGRMKKP